MMAGQYVFRADPLLDRVEQDQLQVAAADRVLRPCIAGGAPARLRPDELTELVVIAEFGGLDRGFGQCIAKAELDEFAHRIRLKIDAEADCLDVCDRLIDPYIDARSMEAERRRKPADAGANHHHGHDRSPGGEPVERGLRIKVDCVGSFASSMRVTARY